MSALSDEIRMMFEKSDTARDAGLEIPEDIERYDDICYGEDLTWQILDVYRPKSQKGRILPVLINVHGGGWVYGDKERYQFYCMSLAEQGFAVVNFTYRLAPEHKYPAAVEDTNLVFHWVLNHVEQYGFDKDCVFAVGDSAGANLLYIYTTICINPVYAEKYLFMPPNGFKPKAIVLNCGAYEIEFGNNSEELTTPLLRECMPEGGTEEEQKWVNALPYMNEEFPPVYLMTATDDFLREQAPIMKSRLEELHIPHQYMIYGTEEHPLGHVFHCDIRSEDGKRCNLDECEFLKSFVAETEK